MPMPQGMPMPSQGGAPQPGQAQGQEQESQDQEGPGKASQIVAEIHDGMMELMDMMQKAKLPPKDIQQFTGVVQAFQQFVEQTLGAGGEEQPQESEQASGAESPEAGGNPNAKPA